MKSRLVIVALACVVSACASSDDDMVQTQTIRVVPEGVPGRAPCEVKDALGDIKYLPTAPAALNVDLGTGPLTVTCKKAGYKTKSVVVEEESTPVDSGFFSFAGSSGTGETSAFPTPIVIRLEPGEDPQIAPAAPPLLAPAPEPEPAPQFAALPLTGMMAAPANTGFSVQVGAFRVPANAAKIVASLRAKGFKPVLIHRKDRRGRVLSRVRIGQIATYKEAFRAARTYRAQNRADAFPTRN